MDPAAVEEQAQKYLLGTYAWTSFHPRGGKGARLVDASGKEYWDLLAGIAVNALGYRHPRLVSTLKAEAADLLHVSNLFYQPAQSALAERLVTLSGLAKAFFCNSGTEANEAALKFARLAAPGRPGIVALDNSFHGRTFGSLSMTGNLPYRQPFEPLVPSVTFVAPNDVEGLKAAITDRTGAVFLEPIQGEGGIVPLAPEFLAAAREACTRTGAVLVFDEIQCGLGRTGHLFAFQWAGVVPDVVTMAKPLGGGLPLGAVLLNETVAAAVKPGHHGTTFGGNPVACRMGLAVLSELEEKGLRAKVADAGVYFAERLKRLARRCPAVKEVRGAGLIWGLELDREAGPVQKALLAKGFVVGTARKTVIRLLPPYVIPKPALSAFIVALEETLKESPQ